MTEIFLSFFIFMAIVLIMSLGVLRGRAPIAGSCGGLNNLGVGGACEICGGNPSKCDPESTVSSQEKYFDAS